MIIDVKVKPNSIKNNIEKLEDGTYVICTKERAIDCKANNSVIKMIAKEFGVSYKNILIKSPKSRKKIIEIKLP